MAIGDIGPKAQLRIIATTDLHFHISGYDYFSDEDGGRTGLSRTASLVEHARSEVENSVLLDNGDILQGTPMADLFGGARAGAGYVENPMIAAMNVLEYDAANIGNHDFNFGLGYLERTVAQAEFPFVCSNVKCPGADGDCLAPPFAILERALWGSDRRRHDLKIGVVGFVPPQIMKWDRYHLEGRVEARDIVDAAALWLPHVKAQGVDLVIALAHCGISDFESTEGLENAALALAEVDGIDAIIAGHTHKVFPGSDHPGIDSVDQTRGVLGNIPAVMPGANGSHLGIIDLTLEMDRTSWRVVQSVSSVRKVRPDTPEDARVLAATRSAHDATLAHIRAPVGFTNHKLNTQFALVAKNDALELVARAQLWHFETAAPKQVDEGLPVLSATAPFLPNSGRASAYLNIPPGPILRRDVAKLYPFPNAMAAVLVNGASLMVWLEQSASIFSQIEPGDADVDLINPDIPSYNFDFISGLDYQIDLSHPAQFDSKGNRKYKRSGRIGALRYNGKNVSHDDHFIVLTNSYRADGGGNFAGVVGAPITFRSDQSIQEIVVDFLKSTPLQTVNDAGHWSLSAPSGATALFRSGAGASRNVPENFRASIDLVNKEDGSETFRLKF